MGKKCSPQAFVGIPAGKFFRRGDGDGELFPDGEFPVAIPNRGQAGGSTSSAVERVDGAGALAGDTFGVDLAPETTTSVISPQHVNPKRTDDASTLAEDLLGVSLVPEITVQSVSNATSSPSIDREVPFVFHLVPCRFSFDPPSDPASVDAFIKAYSNLPGYHMWST
jgi:hypothetical protein